MVGLARIETLVVITALLMVVRYILDLFCRRSVNKILRFVLIILTGVPHLLLQYTIGLMQLTKSNNDMYQVWAVVLVTLQYSIRAVIINTQNPLQDLMSSFWTGNLLGTRATILKIPLWFLWSLNSIRIIQGFAEAELTSRRRRKDLMLLTEYMRTEHNNPPLDDCDARTMIGYKYLVLGEDKQRVMSDPPKYSVRLEVTEEKKFITTNKIWERNGTLLGNPNGSNELKDLCLAFALFKLLRRRFFGLPIHEAKNQKTKDLVLKGLIQNNDYERAFWIIEAELAFLNDFFFTRFAVMFAKGFPIMRLVLSLSVMGVACYLALIFHNSTHRMVRELSKTANGVAITWTLLGILAIKEIWEMLTYVLSDWTKVVLISNYTQQIWWMKCPVIVAAVRCLCKCKITGRWHRNLWQYNLLQSFQYRPHLANRHCSLRRMLFKRRPGYKGSPEIRLPREVKEAIAKSLQDLCIQPVTLEQYLSTVANSIPLNLEQITQLTGELVTETRKILVWHIATCYCEINLATTSQNSPKVCLRSPFLLEDLNSVEEGLQSHYEAATALSQYSAHLLTLATPLVPGCSLVATEIFKSTVEKTREYLHSCCSLEDVLRELQNLANATDGDGGNNGKILLEKGVKLGMLLEETGTKTERWEFLKKFWARYLLYLASSISPDSHNRSLSRGGEFLNHVWALLSHAGDLGNTYQQRQSWDVDYSADNIGTGITIAAAIAMTAVL